MAKWSIGWKRYWMNNTGNDRQQMFRNRRSATKSSRSPLLSTKKRNQMAAPKSEENEISHDFIAEIR